MAHFRIIIIIVLDYNYSCMNMYITLILHFIKVGLISITVNFLLGINFILTYNNNSIYLLITFVLFI